MNVANWSSIAILRDQSGFLFSTTAAALEELLTADRKNVSVRESVGVDRLRVDNALQQILSNGARIIFATVISSEVSLLLCRGSLLGLAWPATLWIFHTHTILDIISDSACELDILLPLLENVILLHSQLQQEDPDTVLVSGKTFREYRQGYTRNCII